MGVVLSLLILGLFVLQQKLTSRPSFSLIRALLDIYSGFGGVGSTGV
jgi:Trk-type K+ transport system membrane component